MIKKRLKSVLTLLLVISLFSCNKKEAFDPCQDYQENFRDAISTPPPYDIIKLYEIIDQNINTDYVKTKFAIDNLFRTSKILNYQEGIAKTYYYTGCLEDAHRTMRSDAILDNYEEALACYEEVGSREGVALCYMRIGMVYARHKLYDAALLSYNKSLAWFKVIENKEEEATVLRQIGLLYWNKKDYDLAIANFNQSLKLCEANGDKRGIAELYNHLGIAYEDKGDLSQAKMYYEQSIAISQEINAQKQLGNSLNNMGLILRREKKYELAMECFIKVLNIDEKTTNPSGLARTYSSIGFTHLEFGKYTEAIEWLMKGKKIAEDKLDDKKLVIDINIDIATAYEKLGNVNQAQSFKQEAEELRDEFESDQKRLMRRENRMQKRIEKEAHGFMYDEQRKSSCDTMFQKINNQRPLFKFVN